MNEPSHSCSNASYCFNGTCAISICLHFHIICQSIPSSYLLHHHQLFSQFPVAHPPSPSADRWVDGTECSEEIFPLLSPPLHKYLLTHTQSLLLLQQNQGHWYMTQRTQTQILEKRLCLQCCFKVILKQVCYLLLL